MKKQFLILLICVAGCQSKPTIIKAKTYYFYNAKELFHCNNIIVDSYSHYLSYTTDKEIPPRDSFSVERGYKVYELIHYSKFSNYRDTSFVKPKSYLDSIDYYSTEWFKKEENLDKFWKTSSGRFDSLKIYVVEPIEGTDSLMFRRVHRSFDRFSG